MRTHFGERDSHVREFVMLDTQNLRARMEAAVETLIALLDELDGEFDREPDNDEESIGDDEPYIGWSEYEAATGSYSLETLDREDEHDGTEPEGYYA